MAGKSYMGGGVSLMIGGAPRALRFDWCALSALREKYGPTFQDAINDAMMGQDFAVMADVIAAGSPGLSADDVMRDSPPVVDAVRAISAALRLAFYGPEGQKDRPLADRAARLMDQAKAAISSLTHSRPGSNAERPSPHSGPSLPGNLELS